jgi:nucleotide-binding universal stress UspA family protein
MSIMICYDGSSSAKHAIAVAAAVMPESHVTLLHVWNPPDPVLADAFSEPDVVAGSSGRSLEQFCLDRADEVLSEGRSLAVGVGLVVEGRLERSRRSVAATILQVAAELDAIVVIGTSGATAVQSDALGSVSHAVVYQSRKPVLVVPTPAAEGAGDIEGYHAAVSLHQ